MAAVNFNVDLENDPELKAVKDDEAAALKSDAAMFDEMITNSDKHFQGQIDAVKEYGETQKKNQQEQTDFAIEQINQQKGQAKKDYIKEQSGAYVDWQKQSNQYGVNAERTASMGMADAGYSESSQVSMYNTYQNRVTTAREVYARAVLNYDNAIKDAILQNNAALAEIAFNSLSKQLELSLAGFQYKNTLITQKAESARQIRNEYFTKWKTVLDQINTEKAREEEQRQFNENKALQEAQLRLEREKFSWTKAQASSSGGSGGSGGSSGGGSINKGSSSSSSGGSGKVNSNSSGGGNKQSAESVATTAYTLANKTKSNKNVATYLDEQVAKGNITEKQADEIYAKCYKLENSLWKLVDDGGVNWFGGLDNNMKVKDESGNTYTLKELKKALIESGYSKARANAYVSSLQNRFQ